MIHLLKKSFHLSFLVYYRLEYIIIAYLSFFILKFKGTNLINRTKNRLDISHLKKKLENNHTKRLAIFVAFHSQTKIPESNLNYINILNKCSFTTVYIINGKLSNEVLEKLNILGCYVICRENVGQDFGAWKDGIALLKKYKIIDDLKWLLLCNDSNFCLGGSNSNHFIEKFSEELNSNEAADFISLNCNYESRLHYQSYFLCLSNSIFHKKSFSNFWEKYIPLNHRFHAIKSGEKKFTTKILNKFRPKIMYTSHELSENIISNIENDYHLLLKNLPKSLFFLEAVFDNNSENKKDIQLGIIKIINSLESYNPSHVFGLLNIIYLKSPFLKKDVMRQGVFSYSQIYEILKLEKLNIDEKIRNQIMDLFLRGGTTYSFMESRRTAFRKGIPVFGGIYEYQFESTVIRDKYFKK